MEEDQYHSLNKGVFVIPFKGSRDGRPGPSSRPLAKVYDEVYARYQKAYEDYEQAHSGYQLDEIQDWLDRAESAPLIKSAFPVHRLPVALIQNLSASVAPELDTLSTHAVTINAREMHDVTSATRAVAVAFMGEAVMESKKVGRTPIDAVERWWKDQKDASPMVIHIQQAQIIPATVMADLMYILNLHKDVPIRLLLSVASIATFMTTWSLLEPSEVDLSLLGTGRSRKRTGAAHAILEAAANVDAMPIAITEDLENQLKAEEELLGGGAAAALKTLKWSLLHHSFNSPLATLPENGSRAHLEEIGAIIEGIKEAKATPGQELFTVEPNPDLVSVHNPAPRMSILQAMAKPLVFLNSPQVPQAANVDTESDEEDVELTPSKNARGKKRARASPSPDLDLPPATEFNPTHGVDERFKEIAALHSLWQGAGKSVNLWDWLEGFRDALAPEEEPEPPVPSKPQSEAGETENGDSASGEAGPSTPQKRKRNDDDDEEAPRRVVSEEEEQRQHATFIRFVEEARMLGLVRARGAAQGRKGDEVAKAVLM